MAEIVVVGSINLDLVVPVERVPLVGETVLGGDLKRIPGGKGANQAVAAARLGRRVAMIGRVGDDDAGEMLRASLADNGVDTAAVAVTDGTASGIALIAVAADGDNAIVVSPGANARLAPADITAAGDLLQAASVVLLQLETPIETVSAAAAAAKAAGGLVVLNPAPAPKEPLPAELLASVDVMVPNQTELATLVGRSASEESSGSPEDAIDPQAAARLAAELPCRQVVVTLGAQGALVVSEGAAEHVPAPIIEPVDTTAAGDGFCAALADAVAGGAGLAAAARWAVRVGATACLRPGAQPSLPTPAEVIEG